MTGGLIPVDESSSPKPIGLWGKIKAKRRYSKLAREEGEASRFLSSDLAPTGDTAASMMQGNASSTSSGYVKANERGYIAPPLMPTARRSQPSSADSTAAGVAAAATAGRSSAAAPLSSVSTRTITLNRMTPNASLGFEIELYNVMVCQMKNRRWKVGDKKGIEVLSTVRGGLAYNAGICENDLIAGVNNVIWDAQNPKKSYRALHTELKTMNTSNITLLVIPAAHAGLLY